MEPLQNLETYKSLLKENRSVFYKGYSNNYMSFEMVRRYIQLGRIYYCIDENGVLFYTNEGEYYRLCFQIGAEADIQIPKLNKPILIRNIYRENTIAEPLKNLHKQLQKQEFKLYDESIQILAHPFEHKDEIEEKCKKTEKFLNRMGMHISYAKKEHMEQIMVLRDHTPELKIYHFPYETDDEILEAIEKGYFRCAFNEAGEVCLDTTI